MWCLWNGEYGEHDLDFYKTKSCSEKNVQRMEAEYEKYPGTIVGDFTCVKVEYDWGRRDQRWTIRCNLCGKESFMYHAKAWRRRKVEAPPVIAARSKSSVKRKPSKMRGLKKSRRTKKSILARHTVSGKSSSTKDELIAA